MHYKVTYHKANTNKDLREILKLQEQNLREVLSLDQKKKEGFVTVKHDFETLKRMNDACGHCIAICNGKLVGYALSMAQSLKSDIPLLVPMFIEINKALKAQNKNLNYIVMGQICIDKSQRGKGVFRGLYHYMAQELKHDFDVIITAVDTKNTRSSNAHKAVGFTLIKKYISNNQFWEIISLKI